MDWKDYAIIGLVLLVVGVPIGVHFHHKGRGDLRKHPQNTDGTIIDDARRLGAAITTVGGRTIAEGAKAMKMGSLKYNTRLHMKEQQQVGGA